MSAISPRTTFSALACAALLAGCGGTSGGAKPAASAQPSTSGRASLTTGQARTIKLGVTEKQFIAQYGEPADPFRKEAGSGRCGFYDVPGQDPTHVQWKVCFKKAKLNQVSSFYH